MFLIPLRDALVSGAIGQKSYGGVTYSITARNISGLIAAGSTGVNHGSLVTSYSLHCPRTDPRSRYFPGWYCKTLDGNYRLIPYVVFAVLAASSSSCFVFEKVLCLVLLCIRLFLLVYKNIDTNWGFTSLETRLSTSMISCILFYLFPGLLEGVPFAAKHISSLSSSWRSSVLDT